MLIKGAIIGVNRVQIMGHWRDRDDHDKDPPEIPLREYEPEEGEDGDKKQLSFANELVGRHKGSRAPELVPEQHTLGSEERIVMHTVEMKVVIKDKTLNGVFTLVLMLMVIINTVNMGSQLDLDVIKEVFKEPIGPAVGFASQFLIMPVFSFLTGWLLSDDLLFRLGFFILGCCPGGSASNFWCLLLGGDINLSIIMTFISTVAALGMMPLWVYLVGPLGGNSIS